MRHQLEDLLKVGITSLNVAGVRPSQLSTVQEIYEAWGETLPRTTMQVRLSPGYDQNDTLEEGIERSIQELRGLGIRTGFGNDRLKLGAIKMSVDGGFSGRPSGPPSPIPTDRISRDSSAFPARLFIRWPKKLMIEAGSWEFIPLEMLR